MQITFNSGQSVDCGAGKRITDILKLLEGTMAESALIARIDGNLVDLNTRITEDTHIDLLTYDDPDARESFRHTASHILMQAVKNIFPTVMSAKGQVTANGFYCDFDFKTPITIADFDKIEKEMAKLIDADFVIERQELAKKTVQTKLRTIGEDYKLEILSGFSSQEKVTIYKQGDFFDLCKGIHLPSTGKVRFIKLTSLGGAYWRGNENNKMLTRIFGAAFINEQDYKRYNDEVDEAKKRDHNRLGRELKLFNTDEMIGQGLPLILPKGARIIQTLQRFIEDEEQSRGYEPIRTPSMAKPDIFKVSSHWQLYRNSMFVVGDGRQGGDDALALKPVTFPFHYSIFNLGILSYRELPKKFSETATLYRDENSGEMHGLYRLRQFTASDAHIFCAPGDIKRELDKVLDLIRYIIGSLGIAEDVKYMLSVHDGEISGAFGGKESWQNAEDSLRRALNDSGVKYCVGIGEAAFFGPKIDVLVTNVWGKQYQIMSIKLDVMSAERFDIKYVAEDGSKVFPGIIRHSTIGSYERILAFLIEKYAGALPLWLCPVQARVIALSKKNIKYAEETVQILKSRGIRCDCDNRDEKIGYKIREAQLERIPYMVVVGEKEQEMSTVSVRTRKDGDLGSMTLDKFIAFLLDESSNKVCN